MVVCFLDFHDIKESPKKIQKPVVDLLESLHETQSTLEKAHSCTEDDAAKNNP